MVLDGAMGTMIQRHRLSEADFRGGRFADWPIDLRGNNDLLTLTQPEIIAQIHREYLLAGADVISTNTFNSTADFAGRLPAAALAGELNLAAARLARAGRRTKSARDDRPPALRGRRARAHQPHGIAVARRERSGISQRRFRRAGGELLRGRARADRGRRRRHPDRDHFRHLECEGGALRGARGARRSRAWICRIIVSGTITDASGRTLVGSDHRGVLELHPPRQARGGGAQLRARREATAALHRGTVADRRYLSCAPTRTPACRMPSANTTRPPCETAADPAGVRGRAASSTWSAAAAARRRSISARSPRRSRASRRAPSPRSRPPAG